MTGRKILSAIFDAHLRSNSLLLALAHREADSAIRFRKVFSDASPDYADVLRLPRRRSCGFAIHQAISRWITMSASGAIAVNELSWGRAAWRRIDWLRATERDWHREPRVTHLFVRLRHRPMQLTNPSQQIPVSLRVSGALQNVGSADGPLASYFDACQSRNVQQRRRYWRQFL